MARHHGHNTLEVWNPESKLCCHSLPLLPHLAPLPSTHSTHHKVDYYLLLEGICWHPIFEQGLDRCYRRPVTGDQCLSCKHETLKPRQDSKSSVRAQFPVSRNTPHHPDLPFITLLGLQNNLPTHHYWNWPLSKITVRHSSTFVTFHKTHDLHPPWHASRRKVFGLLFSQGSVTIHTTEGRGFPGPPTRNGWQVECWGPAKLYGGVRLYMLCDAG